MNYHIYYILYTRFVVYRCFCFESISLSVLLMRFILVDNMLHAAPLHFPASSQEKTVNQGELPHIIYQVCCLYMFLFLEYSLSDLLMLFRYCSRILIWTWRQSLHFPAVPLVEDMNMVLFFLFWLQLPTR